MIIFINEEAAYHYWISHHRDGFVLDGRVRPHWSHLILHRATCPLIKDSSKKRQTHRTSRGRFKACSIDHEALVAFAREVLAQEHQGCAQCSPDEALATSTSVKPHLTHLSGLIVDYVLDAAMIHLDDENRAYQLSIDMIAKCMGKSVGQLSATMSRLFADGYLEAEGPTNGKGKHAAQQLVFPTALALKTLPYYSELSDELLQVDLAKLRGE